MKIVAVISAATAVSIMACAGDKISGQNIKSEMSYPCDTTYYYRTTESAGDHKKFSVRLLVQPNNVMTIQTSTNPFPSWSDKEAVKYTVSNKVMSGSKSYDTVSDNKKTKYKTTIDMQVDMTTGEFQRREVREVYNQQGQLLPGATYTFVGVCK
jgi:hypothetical protein